ncbi:hypothetical protein EYF80_027313 [Liparis tanakae]|uniref:Uncharacterized protein n=1 Tax=Liparis tanakae TaxID=230148 RepID=A0A4Z2HAG8_9TELE|nr:hypothetical protein EYF80_027313 [Liparis tanakae]
MAKEAGPMRQEELVDALSDGGPARGPAGRPGLRRGRAETRVWLCGMSVRRVSQSIFMFDRKSQPVY